MYINEGNKYVSQCVWKLPIHVAENCCALLQNNGAEHVIQASKNVHLVKLQKITDRQQEEGLDKRSFRHVDTRDPIGSKNKSKTLIDAILTRSTQL